MWKSLVLFSQIGKATLHDIYLTIYITVIPLQLIADSDLSNFLIGTHFVGICIFCWTIFRMKFIL